MHFFKTLDRRGWVMFVGLVLATSIMAVAQPALFIVALVIAAALLVGSRVGLHLSIHGLKKILPVVIGVLVALPMLAAQAQTNTPIPPTATVVPISINTNSLLTQINTWTGSLDDIVFLGVAISIAIALLTFIGAQVLGAFRSGQSGK